MQLSTLASMCWLLKCKAALSLVMKFTGLLLVISPHFEQGQVFFFVGNLLDYIVISFKIRIISLSLISFINPDNN